MITSSWHCIDLCIGDWPVVRQVECKLDLTFSDERGWHLYGVMVDGHRIERDGAVKLPTGRLQSHLGRSIFAAADSYFDTNRDRILEDEGLFQEEAA